MAGGRVVKGIKFQELRDVGDPVELGAAYSDRGADELVFLDVKATLEERDTLVGVVRRVAEQLAIPFTVGGGIRTVADADALLSAGADKVSVNSAALAGPSLITSLAEKLGSQAVVVAIDTEGGRVRTRAGTTETRARHGRVGDRGRAARGGGDPAHVDRLRRDARGLRPRDHARGRRRRLGAGHRLGRRRATPAMSPTRSRVAQAALLASILHEDPERLTSLREELRDLGVRLRDAA